MGAGPYCSADLRDRRPGAPSGRRGCQLRQAADRLRRDPLRLGHAIHPGPNPRRARPQLLRDGFHLRGLARDSASHLHARGNRTRLFPRFWLGRVTIAPSLVPSCLRYGYNSVDRPSSDLVTPHTRGRVRWKRLFQNVR